MADMLADLGGKLVRWPDHRDRALRVWVQSGTDMRDWDLRYAAAARDAFAEWATDDLPMRFDFVIDSATSDVHVSWIDRFPPTDGMRAGFTKRTTDSNGWIVNADIVVAVHDSAGIMIRPWEIAAIVRHEAGHALGTRPLARFAHEDVSDRDGARDHAGGPRDAAAALSAAAGHREIAQGESQETVSFFGLLLTDDLQRHRAVGEAANHQIAQLAHALLTESSSAVTITSPMRSPARKAGVSSCTSMTRTPFWSLATFESSSFTFVRLAPNIPLGEITIILSCGSTLI